MGIDLAPSRGGRLRYVGELLALIVAYLLLGKLGQLMNPLGGFATLVWPPTALSLVALLLGGYRLWPGVALGALAMRFWMGAPPLAVCGMAVGDTLEALAGAVALRSIPGFQGSLDRFVDVISLIVLAAVASTALSATVGTLSLALGGTLPQGDFARTWGVWWTGDLVADLILAPVLLMWARGPRLALSPAVLAEAAALGALLITLASLVFFRRSDAAVHSPVLLPSLMFLPLAWAALRFGTRGAATGAFVVAVAAICGTYTGRGALERENPIDGLIALNVFLASASLTSLALGAVVCELKQSRKELGESERRLRAMLDTAVDAVYVKDRLGRYVIVNPACASAFGLPDEAVLGKDDRALLPPDDAARVREVDREIMQTGRPATIEEPVTIAGTVRVYHTNKTPYRDPAGHLVGVMGISRDITEQKRVERALRESEEQQRLAVEAAELGTWCWDVKKDELVWSPLSRRMHDIGLDEAASCARLLAALHPDDRDRVEAAIRRSLDEHAEYRIEYRAVWRDGDVRWISVLGRAFHDAAGRPERMMGVALDVTPQKQAEQERAGLLAREQAALAEAQAAARAKDEFLAVLSHELRTPLQSMLGWTQMLKAEPHDADKVKRGLATIERNVRRQAQLIEDLLDVSRIVAGRLRLERTRVDLAEVVTAALQDAAGAAEAKSIRLDVRTEPLEGVVLGDPDRLQQIVANLLANAVKFTPDGGRIAVRLERHGTTASITVADTGRGIAADFLPYVFDRLRQAETGTARRQGGLGLGLAIVRHLVEAQGGTVIAESPGEGLGATFTVCLSLVSVERRALRPRWNNESRTAGPSVLAGARVLVVDDDADARELLEMVLSASGAEVRTVDSVRAAVDALAAFQPDLLLSDIGMPVEDGYVLIREVRAREAAGGGHLPAIALTAFASHADREEALARGFEVHLAKPANANDLARAVADLLGRAA